MKPIIKRLLVFFIGLPAVAAVVLFLPFFNNLALNIVVIFFSAVGAVELSSMLEKKQLRITKPESFILGALAPVSLTLTIVFNLPQWIILLMLIAGFVWVLSSRAFSGLEKMENVVNTIAAGITVMIYPGIFMFWLVKMTTLKNPVLILVFLLIVFANDSAAWLAGSLFGKNNRGIIPASPNKSIAGYIGGIFGSVITAVVAAFIAPDIFPVRDETSANYLVIKVVLLGFCAAIAGSLGDLTESAIKRSCDVKDSGRLMAGRGGVLDSIDSIAFAAPVFFLLYNLFFL